MKLELVGSRAAGTQKENSDWDIAIDGVVDVSAKSMIDAFGQPGLPSPCWQEVEFSIDWVAVEKAARKKYQIPVAAEVDLFCTAYCATRDLYALVRSTGYTLTIQYLDEERTWI